MIYKTFKINTYNIYTIKTDKFKTCHMEIIFRNSIKKEDVTKRSLLTEMIVENTKKYNTRHKMSVELENLYNAYFYGITTGRRLQTQAAYWCREAVPQRIRNRPFPPRMGRSAAWLSKPLPQYPRADKTP